MSKFKRAWKAFWEAWNTDVSEQHEKEVITDNSHLKLLAILQKKGRLVDFFKENISEYSDSQVGAVVRDIHANCSQILEEYYSIRPVLEDQEGKQVFVPRDYDANKIKLVGNIKGEGPYKGILCHCGWRVDRKELPKSNAIATDVLLPAEVEVR